MTPARSMLIEALIIGVLGLTFGLWIGTCTAARPAAHAAPMDTRAIQYACGRTDLGSPAALVPCGGVSNIAGIYLVGGDWSHVDICEKQSPTPDGRIPIRCWNRQYQPFK